MSEAQRNSKRVETETDKQWKCFQRNISGGNEWQKMDREMKKRWRQGQRWRWIAERCDVWKTERRKCEDRVLLKTAAA